MINQTIKNSDYRAYLDVSDSVDSGVRITIKNPAGGTEISSQDTTLSASQYIYDIDASVLDDVGTYTLEWSYQSSGSEKFVITYVDAIIDSYTRYCYQKDIKRRLYDITLPANIDLSDYTREAASEINRALQGLYVLPLAPDSTKSTYDEDVTAIRKLAADIATGILIDDIVVTEPGANHPTYNQKKAVGFAELKRYVNLEKVFSSVTKDTTRTDTDYESDQPTLSAPRYVTANNAIHKSEFDQVYNNFKPRTDD